MPTVSIGVKLALVALLVLSVGVLAKLALHYSSEAERQEKALQALTVQFQNYIEQVEAADGIAGHQLDLNHTIKEKTDAAIERVRQASPSVSTPVPNAVIAELRLAASAASYGTRTTEPQEARTGSRNK